MSHSLLSLVSCLFVRITCKPSVMWRCLPEIFVVQDSPLASMIKEESEVYTKSGTRKGLQEAISTTGTFIDIQFFTYNAISSHLKGVACTRMGEIFLLQGPFIIRGLADGCWQHPLGICPCHSEGRQNTFALCLVPGSENGVLISETENPT